ncbi:MAG: hypothetical protein EHM73_03110 [Chroococcales cyanobacterium metabat2.561]|uniref:Uncharacterized protein n=1 Tax=Microcystis aeruginosa Ma_SC_T_19800800_S464 TaxID=2486257 RepID=A0A552DYD8_MICAE|nr:MAG: hypothetical protein EHM73_03110 [Chroococcales cyanobacterium metabat2.561]TRU27260.1 MAG: hypothetical protein EWV81_07940 [Microcystis aeruginosa Ma_SC_T_19800800_S464]
MALGNRGVSLELGLISDFITQSKLLGGSTPQTPRRGTKRLPRTPERISFSVGCLHAVVHIFVLI